MSWEQKMAEAFQRLASLDGVSAIRSDDGIAIKGGHLDDFLMIEYLAQLIERGECEFKIVPSRWPYLRKLLKLEDES